MEARLDGVYHTTHVYFSVCGTYATWDQGYPFDVGQALNPNVWSHQPIGYPANAFPMRPSYTAGEVEFVNQLYRWGCQRRTWGFGGYSQGAIVTSNILDRLQTDLSDFADTFIGGVTWGNPRREAGHTLPGGLDPRGHGIVTPNLVNTPDTVWDFACGKGMVGSPGQDLYATCGYDGNAQAVIDEEAVWQIVDKGNIASAKDLVTAIMSLLKSPIKGGYGAVVAIVEALGFFGSGTAPHVNYQFVQPIPGDPRDCWRLALDHLNDLGAHVPARQ